MFMGAPPPPPGAYILRDAQPRRTLPRRSSASADAEGGYWTQRGLPGFELRVPADRIKQPTGCGGGPSDGTASEDTSASPSAKSSASPSVAAAAAAAAAAAPVSASAAEQTDARATTEHLEPSGCDSALAPSGSRPRAEAVEIVDDELAC